MFGLQPKLAEKLAKVLIIAATLVILAGFVGNYIISKHDGYVMDIRNRGTVIAHYIELNLDNRLTALTLLAGDPEIASLENAKMVGELKRAVNKLGFFNIVIFDRDGNFITEAVPSFHIGNVYDRESFNKAIAGRPNISNRIVYAGLDTGYVSLRVPIFDEAGDVKAVLAAGMPIKQIAEMVDQTAGNTMLYGSEYVFIMDSNLNYVSHPRLDEMYPEENIMKGAHREFFEEKIHYRIEKSVLDETEKLYTSLPIEHANWRVIVATPVSSVYMAILKQSVNDIVIFALLLATISLCYRVLNQRRAEKIAQESLQLERLSCASQMAGSIAHEVRNPLTSIKGFIQLIMRKPDKPAPQSYLEVIVSEIERIEKLVTEFQMLSRPIKPAEFESVDVVQIMRDVIMLMEGQALNKKVRLEFDYKPDYYPLVVCRIQGDQSQLKQVMINLLRNAIEAVNEQGHIEVSLMPRNDQIAIEIKDNGAGIPQEVLLKLGTPFYTTKPNGTGLGLSVCFNIIESHGGKLEVRSKVGEGTTFTVLLPLRAG